MFIDARTLPPNSTIEADVCIIGGGPAGITLARELSDARRKVVLLESGGFEYDTGTQALYAGEVIGTATVPLIADRLRFLGGSTNHWQGSCRPFDALDLADWPFGLEVLEPYCRWRCRPTHVLKAAYSSTVRRPDSGPFIGTIWKLRQT